MRFLFDISIAYPCIFDFCKSSIYLRITTLLEKCLSILFRNQCPIKAYFARSNIAIILRITKVKIPDRTKVDALPEAKQRTA